MFVTLSAERLLARLYETFSVPLTFSNPFNGSPISLRAVDRTTGVEITEQKGFLATVRPVAAIRAKDLAALSLKASDMQGVTISLNGNSWRVKSTEPKPCAAGESEGEIYLVLMKRDE